MRYIKKGIKIGVGGVHIEDVTRTAYDITFQTDTLDYLQTYRGIDRGFVNVHTYGAVGDGITDNKAAFDNAIAAAVAQKKSLFIPDGHYKFNDILNVVTLTDDDVIEIIGSGKPLLDFSDIVGQYGYAIDIKGTFSTEGTLNSATEKGKQVLEMSDDTLPSAISEGSVIKIQSSVDYNPGGAGVKIGELNRVQSIDGNNIYLEYPLETAYEIATTTIKNLRAPIVRISNIEIKGNGHQVDTVPVEGNAGLGLFFCQKVYLHNITISGSSYAGVYQEEIFEGLYDNLYIKDCTLNGFGYGLTCGMVSKIVIQNSKILNCRHCVEMGGNYPTRDVIVRNNHVASGLERNAALDNHNGTERVTFDGNYLYGGGMYLRGINTTVINNEVHCTKDGGYGVFIQCYGYPDNYCDHFVIRNNKIYFDAKGDSGEGNYGILLNFYANNQTINLLEISDNVINSNYYPLSIKAQTGYSGSIINVAKISNNYIYKPADAGSPEAIRLSDDLSIGDIMIIGNYIYTNRIGINVYSDAITRLVINSNIVKSKDSPLAITGNNTIAFIKDNQFYSSDGAPCTFQNITNLTLFENIFEAMNYKGIRVYNTVSVFTWDGNLAIGGAGAVENNAISTNAGDNW